MIGNLAVGVECRKRYPHSPLSRSSSLRRAAWWTTREATSASSHRPAVVAACVARPSSPCTPPSPPRSPRSHTFAEKNPFYRKSIKSYSKRSRRSYFPSFTLSMSKRSNVSAISCDVIPVTSEMPAKIKTNKTIAVRIFEQLRSNSE